MAKEIDAVINLNAEVSVQSGEILKSDHFGSQAECREKRCQTLVRAAVVVTMLLLVWALIIVSVASPFFHHRDEVGYYGRYNCKRVRSLRL